MDIEIMVRLHDGTAGRSRGDILRVRETPFDWPASYTKIEKDGKRHYGIIEIKNITKKEFEMYNVRHIPELPDGKGGTYPRVRSKYRFKIESMVEFTGQKQRVLKSTVENLIVSRQIEKKTLIEAFG